MKVKVALCPKHEDHTSYPKRMFYLVDDGLYLLCKKHLHPWIKFKFIKDGRQIDFSNVQVIAEESKAKYFEEEQLPILAYGSFNAKRSKKLRNVSFSERS